MARQLSSALSRLQSAAIVEPPTRVPPCAPLPAILASASDPLLEVIAPLAHYLHWRLPGRGSIPSEISDNMAAVEIVGPSGMILTDECRYGLFIQRADLHYPEHCHEAEELYLTLHGTADWGTDETPPRPVAPGTFIHHPSWQPHIMNTREEPLLAMWGWTGNLDFSTYTMGRRPVA
jgi:dimethylpropiothetin dethiomethylase